MSQLRNHWQIGLALTLTALWLLLGAHYIINVVGWARFVQQPADAIGGFLEGSFAPLAFLWLVVGYFIQQRALKENTKVIEQQARQSHRDSFVNTSNLVMRELGVIAGFLYISSQGPTGSNRHTDSELNGMWNQLAAGNDAVFLILLLQMDAANFEPNEYGELYFGTEVRRKHAENFMCAFEKLLRQAREVDIDGLIQDALIVGTAQGLFYQRLQATARTAQGAINS
ncbi:MAG: hypothetical protein SV583_05735 [Pseudomonadota bacterium]|nr:hypothetical protein [Pseudomonadota bacterium]